jgi:hypothetical protein
MRRPASAPPTRLPPNERTPAVDASLWEVRASASRRIPVGRDSVEPGMARGSGDPPSRFAERSVYVAHLDPALLPANLAGGKERAMKTEIRIEYCAV